MTAIAAATLICVPAIADAAAFDGTWKVSRTSDNCRPKSPIKVTIADRKISGSYWGASGKHQVTGTISADGRFTFTARSPRDDVVFKGTIKGSRGQGSWNVRNGHCNGALTITN
ncbi:MAG: hypothetical protein KDJ16_04930 [Hyphomicrobiales bacterium]|nr:hypothetical protein [Hyphomicrobiales bacterium]